MGRGNMRGNGFLFTQYRVQSIHDHNIPATTTPNVQLTSSNLMLRSKSNLQPSIVHPEPVLIPNVPVGAVDEASSASALVPLASRGIINTDPLRGRRT